LPVRRCKAVKFFPLMWAGLWRKKGRTALNLVSILVAFCLFGVLQGMSALFYGAGSSLRADRLVVLSREGGFGGALPISYLDRIERVPHVVAANYRSVFFGIYQHPPQFATGFAVDPHRFFATATEYVATPQAIADLIGERDGMLASVKLMQKYGWKIGDRIPLKHPGDPTSGDGAGNWSFVLVGSFDTPDNAPGQGPFVFNYDYFNQGRTQNKGTISSVDVRVDDPSQAAAVCSAIDALFDNSPAETLTQPFSAAVQTSLTQAGDLDYIIHAVLAVVFNALLVSVGSVMMRGMRDRTPELAVLKTIGFTDRAVALMLIAENLLLSLVGAGLGLGAARALLPVVIKSLSLNYSGMPSVVIWEACVLAVLFALAVGVLPARRAARLEIVDAIGGH